jgi:hypothetical protein
MKLKEIIEKVLEKNPEFNKGNLTIRADGRIEYICAHEIGHTVYSPNNDYIHGCDRCCKKYNIIFPEDLDSQ